MCYKTAEHLQALGPERRFSDPNWHILLLLCKDRAFVGTRALKAVSEKELSFCQKLRSMLFEILHSLHAHSYKKIWNRWISNFIRFRQISGLLTGFRITTEGLCTFVLAASDLNSSENQWGISYAAKLKFMLDPLTFYYALRGKKFQVWLIQNSTQRCWCDKP